MEKIGVFNMKDYSPDRIYLQDEFETFKDDSFNSHETITWAEHRIHDNDIEYVKIGMLHDAMSLLMNHEHHEDEVWQKEYNELCCKYLKEI